jgi:hypothetical protein
MLLILYLFEYVYKPGRRKITDLAAEAAILALSPGIAITFKKIIHPILLSSTYDHYC